MSRKYILIIDDDADILAMLGVVLESEGFEVVQKPTARGALLHVQHEARPALILVDMMMPEMDGRTFCATLEHTPALRSIPVVVMSAAPVRLGSNVVGYLKKPFDIDQLLGTIAPFCCSAGGMA